MDDVYSRQCHNCKHFEDDSDPSVGMYGQEYCTAIPSEEDGASEQVQILLNDLMFALAGMKACPRYEKRPSRYGQAAK